MQYLIFLRKRSMVNHLFKSKNYVFFFHERRNSRNSENTFFVSQSLWAIQSKFEGMTPIFTQSWFIFSGFLRFISVFSLAPRKVKRSFIHSNLIVGKKTDKIKNSFLIHSLDFRKKAQNIIGKKIKYDTFGFNNQFTILV